MAKGTGTYDDPILVDGLFSKTINGVKKFFKIKTGSSVDTSQFIKKSGDILTGNRFTRNVDNDYLYFNGGTHQNGAALVLYGKEPKTDAVVEGSAELRTKSDLRLQCKDNGALIWNNKNIVRSINSILADKNGNIQFILDSLLNSKEEGFIHLFDNFILAWSNKGNMSLGVLNAFLNKPKPFTTLACIMTDHILSTTELSSLGDLGTIGWYKNRSTKTTDYFYYSNPKVELGAFSVIWIGVIN